MPKSADTLKKRKCPYCKGEFKPERAYPVQRFCCDNHRKLFHRYGGLPLQKVLDRAEKTAREIVAGEIAELRGRVEFLTDVLGWHLRAQHGIIEDADGIFRDVNGESVFVNIAAAARGALVGGGA